MKELIQELTQKYNFKCIWIDSSALHGEVIYFATQQQGLFTIIKRSEDLYILRYRDKESGFSKHMDRSELIYSIRRYAKRREAEQMRLL